VQFRYAKSWAFKIFLKLQIHKQLFFSYLNRKFIFFEKKKKEKPFQNERVLFILEGYGQVFLERGKRQACGKK